MDIVKIQSLITQGKVIDLTSTNPDETYLQVGVYQTPTSRRSSSDANAYAPYVIPLSALLGYNQVQDEGIDLPQRQVLNFKGAGVLAIDNAGVTDVNIPGTGLAVRYGSFYDTTDQTLALNAIGAMKFNTTDLSVGVTMGSNGSGNPTRITVSAVGIYNIQFSAQLDRPQGGGGSLANTNIWLRKGGLDLPWTNTKISMQSNSRYHVAAWNWFVSLNAGEYVEIMWSQDDAIYIAAEPAGVHPAIPSTILTVNQIA